ncbi:MAG TPA: CinA family nicotinamide mononucleotide deamidase-related protein, partial [bacterium]|nr:CinA family nicotinamide mononucleotide deamidase-related protein [bacterium]
KFLNKKLILHHPTLNKIKKYFQKIKFQMPSVNKKQAYFPENSIILENQNGTAPGCIIEEQNRIFVVLPGPPRELIPMFENVINFLKKKIKGPRLYVRQLKCLGLGESAIAEKIKKFLNLTNPYIATYAKQDCILIKIMYRSESEKKALPAINSFKKKIKKILGNIVFTDDDKNIEDVVAELLISKNETIAIAESCTGGLVTSKLVNYPGISKVLVEAVVVYSNISKIRRLGVKEKTIIKHGAVSKQTAKEMALGIKNTASADIGISITGIAGPAGGSKTKPVGLVYFGLAIQNKVFTYKYIFNGNRQTIRQRAALTILNILRLHLLEAN